MRRSNDKKKFIIMLFLLLVVGLGIGYAILTQQLNINNSISYEAMKWDVGFVSSFDGNGTIASSSVISNDKKKITVSCEVGSSVDAETCILRATVRNGSSFKVMLSEDPTITYDDTYIDNVELIWMDNYSTIKSNDVIASSVIRELVLTIYTKELTRELLPENGLNVSITFTMNWVETTDSNNGNEDGISNVLISNDKFTYGTYLAPGNKNVSEIYNLLKSTDEMYEIQKISLEVDDDNLDNYIVTFALYDKDGNFLSLTQNNEPLLNGRVLYNVSDFLTVAPEAKYFRVNIGIFIGVNHYVKVPESAIITVYSCGASNYCGSGNYDTSDTKMNEVYRLFIDNEDFTYGSYLSAGGKNTSGAFGMLKTTDEMYEIQSIIIEVDDDNLDNYIVTFALYDSNMNFIGLTNNNEYLRDGKIIYDIRNFLATYANAKYFRVNIGIFDGSSYSKVPETADIKVYTSSSVLNGKNIYVIGDSITVGEYLDNPSLESYSMQLQSVSLANVTVDATSGIKLVGGITSKVANMNANADLVIVFGGTNDYWHGGVHIGSYDSDDTSTYYGALKDILKNLKNKNPNAEYLFIFPPEQEYNNSNSGVDKGYGTLDDFRIAFIDFCTINNVKYLDLNTITNYNISKHTVDGVHPNKNGHILFANYIYEYLQNNYK